MIEKTDQWLLEGKCTMCRRAEYCSKPCRACNSRKEYELRCAVSRALAKTMLKEGGAENDNKGID